MGFELKGGDNAPEPVQSAIIEGVRWPRHPQTYDNEKLRSDTLNPLSRTATFSTYRPFDLNRTSAELHVHERTDTPASSPQTSSPQASYTADSPWIIVKQPPSSSSYDHGPEVVRKPGEDRTRFAGCPLVLILWCLVGFFLAATIAFAAGLGVEAGRAMDYAAMIEKMNASLLIGAPTESSPGKTPNYNALDRGCTLNATLVNGTSYSSFSLMGNDTFTVYCNMDTPHAPILSLFAPDFDTCMDACTSYTKYLSPDFRHSFSNATNATCHGVSFIPLWTTKKSALAGKAPGNCYLKPGPLRLAMLKIPKIGTECHSALVVENATSKRCDT